MEFREEWIRLIEDLQNTICSALEQEDGRATFREDKWERPEGGGGKTRIIANGDVFEKGGVNTSVVHGLVSDAMRNQLNIHGHSWFAAGISLVLHPYNPFVPTVHCNYRMFELYDEDGMLADRWFGGGTDLTPSYLIVEDVVHFHRCYRDVCDGFDPLFYPAFKKHCDDYFINHHRGGERRGLGGIFYDYQRPSTEKDAAAWMKFAGECGRTLLTAYLPIVQRNKQRTFTNENRYWQEIRRGRYVEFNLVHDRGTLFGLRTNGRIESILMSLPPVARFEYDHQPAIGSAEHALLQACLQPVDWLNLTSNTIAPQS